MMKVILETRRVHEISYLSWFCCL